MLRLGWWRKRSIATEKERPVEAHRGLSFIAFGGPQAKAGLSPGGQAKLTWPCGPPKKMKVAGTALPKAEGLSRKINNLDATLEIKLTPHQKRR